MLPATEKCTLKWGAWKIASRGINGVSLVRHFLKQARWPVLLFIFFGTAIGREHWKKNFKNCQITFFFWGITLICQILTAVNVDSSQSDYSVWLLIILSRHSLIIIKFIRTIMHHHKKIMNIVIFSLGAQKQCTSSPQIWYKKIQSIFLFPVWFVAGRFQAI